MWHPCIYLQNFLKTSLLPPPPRPPPLDLFNPAISLAPLLPPVTPPGSILRVCPSPVATVLALSRRGGKRRRLPAKRKLSILSTILTTYSQREILYYQIFGCQTANTPLLKKVCQAVNKSQNFCTLIRNLNVEDSGGGIFG